MPVLAVQYGDLDDFGGRLESRRFGIQHDLGKGFVMDIAFVGNIAHHQFNQGLIDLNAVAPLSIATWHRHVDFCGGPRSLPLEEQFGARAKFGPQGSIHTEEACKNAGGLWIPVVFGWMTHVYPNAKAPNQVRAGMDMQMDANTDDKEMKK